MEQDIDRGLEWEFEKLGSRVEVDTADSAPSLFEPHARMLVSANGTPSLDHDTPGQKQRLGKVHAERRQALDQLPGPERELTHRNFSVNLQHGAEIACPPLPRAFRESLPHQRPALLTYPAPAA